MVVVVVRLGHLLILLPCQLLKKVFLLLFKNVRRIVDDIALVLFVEGFDFLLDVVAFVGALAADLVQPLNFLAYLFKLHGLLLALTVCLLYLFFEIIWRELILYYLTIIVATIDDHLAQCTLF